MTKIRLKQIEKMNIGPLTNGQIISYNSDTDSFENIYSVNSDVYEKTIPVRDSKGNIQVGDAIGNSDAVNLNTLRSELENVDLSKILEASETIDVQKDEETGKNIISVIPAGINGNIQKNLNGELGSCLYLYEDTDKKSIEIARSSMYRNVSAESPLLLLTHVTAKDDYDTELTIDVSSFDENHGPSIVTYAAKQSSNNNQMISRNSVVAGQTLFNLSINGYSSTSDYYEALSVKVVADNKFSDSVESHLEVKQCGEYLLTSDKNLNLYTYAGLKIDNSDVEQSGMMRFNGEHYQGYKNNQWVNLDLQATEGTATSEDVIVTVDCGGYIKGDTITAGTTFDDLVKSLLAPYSSPYFEDFNVFCSVGTEQFNDTIIEVGKTVTPTQASIVSFKDSDFNFAEQCEINGVGFSSKSFEPSEDAIEIIADGESISHNTPSEETWIISGQDKNGRDINIEYTIKWAYMAFFGASDDETPYISSLQQANYIESDEVSFQCTSDNANSEKYTYLALPKEFVDSKTNAFIRRNCLNVNGAFSKNDISYMLPDGTFVDYVLYKSNAKGAFSSGNTIRFK